ncbi:unnamed protein product [Rangifer tarandus platyrhynchus]|uniref:Uncharacterized protein n=1 Tax=Rangifer tarandus platyrhynchus TaxID=3082113 RepID=A0ABN8XU49_RANTA|nr:unnamed protein product [Rangifer tarandus platyrhynchus]
MSRVCIVVLEEVEGESPAFISKLPQENKSLHSPPSGNVLVRYKSLYPSLVRAIFNGEPDEVRALIFKKEDVNFQTGCSCVLAVEPSPSSLGGFFILMEASSSEEKTTANRIHCYS